MGYLRLLYCKIRADCDSGRISKIGQYLMKLCLPKTYRILKIFFSGHSVFFAVELNPVSQIYGSVTELTK